MAYSSTVRTALLVLSLSIGATWAVICFEGTPLDTLQGTFYRFSGEESDGQICVNVIREEAEVNMFDFESFRYVVSEVATPIFGGATAAARVDFTPTPIGGSSVSFPQNSTVTELCVDVILDVVACENPEDFRMRLISLNPAISTVCNTEAIVTIRDSTAITVGFTTSTTSVREDALEVSLNVTRSSGIENFNLAALSVVEDPEQGGCIAAPGRIQYPCIAQTGCADGTSTDLTKDVVRSTTLSLVPDDSEIDGHRECQILLRPLQGSMCKFNITRGSTQLRVTDDEILFLRFDEEFYEEDEDIGGVNVTVEMVGFGSVPITASGPVDFSLRIVGGTGRSAAEVGVDLPDREYNSSVPPGQSSTSVRILFNPDDVYELTETFELVLTPSITRYNVLPASPFRADVQIANDDKVTVRFPQNLTVLESDGEISFSLFIAEQYDGEICFTLQTSVIMDVLDGNVNAAKAGEDFESTSGTEICFRNNSRTSDEFTVNILGAAANIPECDEVFSVKLDLPREADPEMIEIPENSATVTIIDTSDPYTLRFSQSEYRVVENDGALDVTVTVDRPPAFDIPFTVVASVTGNGPDDATLFNGLRSDTLDREWNGTISSGESNATFVISILPDNLAEHDEHFNITLSVLSLPKLAIPDSERNTAHVVIEDDDAVIIEESVEGRSREGVDKFCNITFTADGNFVIPFTVTVNFMDGSAVGGLDYDNSSQQITFTETNKVQTVYVPILNDAILEEGEETFQFILTYDPSTKLNISTSSAQGMCIIDDNEVVHFFDVTSYVVAEDSGLVSVFIRRRGYLQRESSVMIVPKNYSGERPARGPQDFPLAPTLAVFASGVEMMSFNVSITPDMISELNETFLLELQQIEGTGEGLVEDLVVEPDEATVVITDVTDIVCVSFSQSAYSSSEGDGSKEFSVVVDKNHVYEFTVLVTVMPVTATFGEDYSNTTIELRFTPGAGAVSGSLSVIDDQIKEMTESVNLVLSVPEGNPRPVCIKSPGTATCNITDNDDLTVQFENPTYTLSEGETITVNVVASTDFSKAFSVAISHNGGGDLTLSSSILNFSPSSRTASILLTAVSDSITEIEESFTLSLEITDQMTREFGVELGERSTANVTLLDTTEAIEVLIRQNYTVTEGGEVNIVVEVNSTDYEFDFTVALNHMNGSAGAPGDYVPGPYQVSFSAGQPSATLSIQTENDNIAELSEYFKVMIVSISKPDLVVIGDPDTSYVTIEDNDVITCSKAPDNATVTEGGVAGLTVECSGQYEFNFTLFLDTMDGSAVAPGDYTSGGYSLSFTAGQTSGMLSVSTLDDTIAELDEYFKVMITGSDRPEKVIIGDPDTCFVTIQDNDVITCSKAPDNATVTEGGVAGLTVECSGQYEFDFTLFLDTMDGSAVAPGDYTSGGYLLSFTAGQASGTLSVSTSDNTIGELEEYFKVMITGSDRPDKVIIGDPDTCFVTIQDNDDVIITFDPSTYTVIEGGSVQVSLVADRDFSEPFNVTVTSDNTEDVSIQPETVTFEPSNRRVSVSVTALTDDIQELTENVTLMFDISQVGLRTAPGDPSQATVSITDATESVVVCFDETAYSVIEGEEVTIGMMANRRFTSSFSLTVTHADPGGDYEVQGIPVTFSPGDSDGSFKFVTFSDNVKELNESVSLMLQVVNDGGLQVEVCPQSTTVVTIFDISILEVEFDRAKYSVSEGDNVTVNIRASNNFTSGFAVSISHNGGNDLMLSSDTITFSPGSLVASVVVTALEDNIKELVESFTLSLAVTNPMSQLFNVELGQQSTTEVEIQDTTADVIVSFSPLTYTVMEDGNVVVRLEADKMAGVDYTIDVTQVNGVEDFTINATYAPAEFSAGSLEATVQIDGISDSIKECDESFRISASLTSSSTNLGVTLGDDIATVTVVDKTEDIVITFDPSTYSVTEGGSVQVSLVADRDFSEPFNVTVTSDNTEDVSIQPETVTFEPSNRRVSVSVTALTDDIQEMVEMVNLSRTIGDSCLSFDPEPHRAVLSIVDNSSSVQVNFVEAFHSVSEGETITISVEADRDFTSAFTVGVEADVSDDYKLLDTSIQFTPGRKEGSIRFRAVRDDVKEMNESVTLTLTIINNGGIDVIVGPMGSTSVNIIDINDLTVQFENPAYTLSEGETITVNVVASTDFSKAFSVAISHNGGGDLTLSSSILNFSPSNRTASVLLTAVSDSITELEESFTLSLEITDQMTQEFGVELGDRSTASVTVLDTTEGLSCFFQQPTYSVTEGDSVNVTIMTSSSAFSFPFTVTLNYMDGSAELSGDYTPSVFTVDFAPGQSSATFEVATVEDERLEKLEEFKIVKFNTSEPDKVSPGSPAMVTVEIEDDDVRTLSISSQNRTVDEGQTVNITLELDSDAFDCEFNVTLVHMDGSATASGDYMSGPYTVVFQPGQKTAILMVTTEDDSIAELTEYFTVMISSTSLSDKIVVGDPDTSYVTILDNDVITCSKAPDNATVTEGGVAELTVECSGQSEFDFTLFLDTMDGSAVVPGDYTSGGYSLSFTAGQTSGILSVQTSDDTIGECDEFFKVMITGSDRPQVQIGEQDTCFATIVDNDDVSITFDRSTYTVMEGGSVQVSLVADRDFSEPFNVTVTSDNTEGVSIQPETVTFEPSSRRVSVSVTAQTDDIQEMVEMVNLSCTIGDSCLSFDPEPHRAVLNIVDNSSSVMVNFVEPLHSVSEGETITISVEAETITISVEADRDFTSAFTVGVEANVSNDYELLDTSIQFTPGRREGSIRFRAVRDEIKQRNESVTLTLNITDNGGIDVIVGQMGSTSVNIIDINVLNVTLDSTQYIVSEGSQAVVLLRASLFASEPYTVNIVTSPGTAEEDDFTSGPFEAIFNRGEVLVPVNIPTNADDCAEPLETFKIMLQQTTSSEALGVVFVSPSEANVTINDPTVVKVSFEETSYTAVEGSSVRTILVTDKCFEGMFEVDLIPTLGSAEGSDFDPPPTTGVTAQNQTEVPIDTVDDTDPEGDEEFQIKIQIVSTPGGPNVEVGTSDTANITIIDNDAVMCQLSDDKYSVNEGETLSVTVECNKGGPESFTITIVSSHVSTDDGDFSQGPYAAVFATGDMDAVVTIQTNSDSCAEPLETFTLSLMAPENPPFNISIGGRSTATVTIVDNTAVPVHFDMTSYQAEEGDAFTPSIVVDRCYSGSFTINVMTADGSARAGTDYTSVNTSVSFSGSQQVNITVNTIEDDVIEQSEDFSASLSIGSAQNGLMVEISSPSATFTILDDEEREVTVSFVQNRYNVKEGDQLNVRFVVMGPSTASFEVRVTSSNGTAFSGVDYGAVDVTVDPRDGEITVPILLDDIMEDIESFQLMLIIPDSATNVLPGNFTTANVFISDLDARTVNDTIIADPVYAVPLKIVDGAIPGTDGDVSLCFEIHGNADSWFNLISDTCLSVNAHYLQATIAEGRMGHIINKLGILAVSSTSQCREVMVSMVEEVCSATVDGSSTEMLDEDGLVVTKRRNRVRISAPNCNNQMVIIWASCEKFAGFDMMKVVVNRGFNLNPTSHGFLGQFWNIDVSLERYNDTIVKIVYGIDTVNPHYIIHLDPPAPAEKRSLVGELYHQQWDMSRKYCLYVGSNQGGAGVDSIKPVGTVVEGTYTDYITNGPFEHSEKFNRFDSSACQSGT